MRLYFLVEGETERKLYPAWIGYLAPFLGRIDDPLDPAPNSYFLISGRGYPQLLTKGLDGSLQDITISGDYDHFVIGLDADDLTVQERLDEVNNSLRVRASNLLGCDIHVVVQNKCVETWLLGNRRVFRRNPSNPVLADFIRFYDVSMDDPEEMTKPEGFDESTAFFHYGYLRRMLAERRMSYSKTHPRQTLDLLYLEQLQERLRACPDHLATLRNFLAFLTGLGDPS